MIDSRDHMRVGLEVTYRASTQLCRIGWLPVRHDGHKIICRKLGNLSVATMMMIVVVVIVVVVHSGEVIILGVVVVVVEVVVVVVVVVAMVAEIVLVEIHRVSRATGDDGRVVEIWRR